MAQSYCNFGAYTSDVQPGDWSFNATVGDTGTAIIRDAGYAPLGKVLRLDSAEATDRFVALWDGPGTALANVEVLIGIRRSSLYMPQYRQGFGPVVHANYSDSFSSIPGYFSGTNDAHTHSQNVSPSNNLSTGWGETAGANVFPYTDIVNDLWHRHKIVETSGSQFDHTLHAWRDGQSPKLSGSTADFTWSDTTYLYAAGRIGYADHMDYSIGSVDIFWLSVGTNGDAAQLPSDIGGSSNNQSGINSKLLSKAAAREFLVGSRFINGALK